MTSEFRTIMHLSWIAVPLLAALLGGAADGSGRGHGNGAAPTYDQQLKSNRG